MEYVETGGLDRGFAPVFAGGIAPEVERLEAQRRALLGQAIRGALVIVGLAVAIGVGLGFASGWEGPGAIAPAVGGMMGIFGALIYWNEKAGDHTGALSDVVMPRVVGFLGDITHDPTAHLGFPTGRLKDLGVVRMHNRVSLAHRIDGSWRGVDYTLVEALLRQRTGTTGRKKSGSKTTTTFDGMLFRIAVPRPAPTTILIAQDYGALGNAMAGWLKSGKGRGMPRVETGHPRFEAKLEMHANSPSAAAEYLPGPILDALVDIAETEGQSGRRGMTAAFDGDSFYLALWRTEKFLKLGGLREPVTGIDRNIHQVFDDLAMVRRIIDRLTGH